MKGVEVADLIADVHPAERLRGIGLRIQLDELAVVDLDEDLGGLAAVGHGKSLFVAELAEEGNFAIEVADAKGNVRDADDAGIGRGRLRDGSRRADANERQSSMQRRSASLSPKYLQSPWERLTRQSKARVQER